MATDFQSRDPRIAHLHTLQPKFRVQVAAGLILLVVALALIAVLKRGPGRFFYGGLDVLTAGLLTARYYKEKALVREHQTADAMVTEYRIRGKHTPYMWHGTPYVKYSFRAFDGRTYTGEASNRVSGLQAGTHLTVLYRTSSPRSSLPLRCFIFYSFGDFVGSQHSG